MDDPFSNGTMAANFRTTHWSVVLEAGCADAQGGQALEELCQAYWYPLYVFVRRRGYPPQEAQDLTQEFFARLIHGESLQSVHPAKGRFRTFLLTAMTHFLAKEWRDANRLKRGGGARLLSWDEINPEERYRLEPETGQSPEEFFDRRWALAVVDKALGRLRAEMERAGDGPRFEALKAHLQSAAPACSYAEAAARAGLSEPAVKSAIHRLRRRYAEIIREEVAHTVQSPDEIEEEIRRLIRMLAA